MAKFLNKKEQVYDFKLTSYGHYLLSVGKFKPFYYTFLDDNVIYDAQYAGIFERQNDVHKRIKDETPYLEGLVLFQDVENLIIEEDAGEINFFQGDVSTIQRTPRKDLFRYDKPIGNSSHSGIAQKSPAWKVVTLNGNISSSAPSDTSNNTEIPQINIDGRYVKKLSPSVGIGYDPNRLLDLANEGAEFADDVAIQLISNDVILYLEELNTEIFSENFDVEVYEILDGTDSEGNAITELQRKYFMPESPQIVNGIMMRETPNALGGATALQTSPTTGNVEYYFDVMTDIQVNPDLACRGALEFNKESYYIDIDFDCDKIKEDTALFNDIYGQAAGEPEICQ
tara:strand:- start:2800 stop:3822 length:1023 start_codon:yes stop_codon:yes gene_type:complete